MDWPRFILAMSFMLLFAVALGDTVQKWRAHKLKKDQKAVQSASALLFFFLALSMGQASTENLPFRWRVVTLIVSALLLTFTIVVEWRHSNAKERDS